MTHVVTRLLSEMLSSVNDRSDVQCNTEPKSLERNEHDEECVPWHVFIDQSARPWSLPSTGIYDDAPALVRACSMSLVCMVSISGMIRDSISTAGSPRGIPP